MHALSALAQAAPGLLYTAQPAQPPWRACASACAAPLWAQADTDKDDVLTVEELRQVLLKVSPSATDVPLRWPPSWHTVFLWTWQAWLP